MRPDDHHHVKQIRQNAITNNVEVVGALPLTTCLVPQTVFKLRTQHEMKRWSAHGFENVPSTSKPKPEKNIECPDHHTGVHGRDEQGHLISQVVSQRVDEDA